MPALLPVINADKARTVGYQAFLLRFELNHRHYDIWSFLEEDSRRRLNVI